MLYPKSWNTYANKQLFADNYIFFNLKGDDVLITCS